MSSQTVQINHINKAGQFEDEEQSIVLQTNVQNDLENALETQPDDAINSCAYCSKEERVTSAMSLQRGQHISLRRRSNKWYKNLYRKLYRHHAIVKETIPCSENEASLTLIHFDKQDGKIKIYETTENYDINEDSLCIIEYNHPRNSPDEIIKKAEDVLKGCGEGKFDNYNPLWCNCEHFATWCVVGNEESFQVQSLLVFIGDVVKSVFGGNGKIASFLLKSLFISSDEIASVLSSAKATPAGLLVGSAVAYGIYCIYYLVSLRQQYYKHKTICKSCFIKNVLKLLAQFAVYIGTSYCTSYVQRIILPTLSPWIGIPLLITLLVASTALFYIIPRIK